MNENRNWAVPPTEKTIFHSKRGLNLYTPSDCAFASTSSHMSLDLSAQKDQVGFVGSYTAVDAQVGETGDCSSKSTKELVSKAVGEVSMRSTAHISTVPRTVVSQEGCQSPPFFDAEPTTA